MRHRYFAPLAAAAAVAASALALPATAHAATASAAAPACTGWAAPYGTETGINTYEGLEYWFSVNNCTGQARGAMIIRSGGYDFHLWVYNASSGVKAQTSSVKHNQSIYTDPITYTKGSTRVCIQPINPSSDAPLGEKKCTADH